jgi:hypothetical protein
MRIRLPMTRLRYFAALLLLFLATGTTEAHMMYVRHRVLPGNQIRIESFFQGGSPAVDGIVRVYRSDGTLLGAPGVMDDKGIYLFSYRKAENLKVKVSCDEHAKEITILAAELTDAPPTAPEALDRAEPSHLAEILSGLGFVFSVAALYLSARTAARLRKLAPQPALPTPKLPAVDRPPPATLPTGPTPG